MNPTREEVERHLIRHEADVKHGDIQFTCHCASCHFGRGYLRALDMQDKITSVTVKPIPKGLVYVLADVRAAIKKFDGGSDD